MFSFNALRHVWVDQSDDMTRPTYACKKYMLFLFSLVVCLGYQLMIAANRETRINYSKYFLSVLLSSPLAVSVHDEAEATNKVRLT